MNSKAMISKLNNGAILVAMPPHAPGAVTIVAFRSCCPEGSQIFQRSDIRNDSQKFFARYP